MRSLHIDVDGEFLPYFPWVSTIFMSIFPCKLKDSWHVQFDQNNYSLVIFFVLSPIRGCTFVHKSFWVSYRDSIDWCWCCRVYYSLRFHKRCRANHAFANHRILSRFCLYVLFLEVYFVWLFRCLYCGKFFGSQFSTVNVQCLCCTFCGIQIQHDP